MFTGKMVTEAIPARVFALYKIVTSKKNISRLALQGLMEPKEIYEGTSYFSTILKTAIELKLVDVQDNYVTAIVPEEKLKTIKRHLEMEIEEKGEYTGIREMRKQLSWYIKGLEDSSKMREKINKLESKNEIVQTITEYFNKIQNTNKEE